MLFSYEDNIEVKFVQFRHFQNPILLKAKFMLCACSSSMLLNSLEVRCLITNSFNRKRSVETWVVNSIDVKLMPRFHLLCHNSLTVNQAIEIPSLHCESRKKRNRLSNTKIWDLKRSTFLSSLYSTDIQHGKVRRTQYYYYVRYVLVKFRGQQRALIEKLSREIENCMVFGTSIP